MTPDRGCRTRWRTARTHHPQEASPLLRIEFGRATVKQLLGSDLDRMAALAAIDEPTGELALAA